MTVAHQAKPLVFTDIDGAIAALRERGLRLSASRRLVLEALFAADGPVSAEHISQRLDADVTSVYRNLDTLERHGLVRHVHLGHGPGLYALLGTGEREYLYCERCGAVRTVSPDELEPVRDVDPQAVRLRRALHALPDRRDVRGVLGIGARPRRRPHARAQPRRLRALPPARPRRRRARAPPLTPRTSRTTRYAGGPGRSVSGLPRRRPARRRSRRRPAAA